MVQRVQACNLAAPILARSWTGWPPPVSPLADILAALFAIRSGVRDAREGRAPYLWALVWESPNRRELVLRGWRDVGRVLLLAVGIDLVYQATVLHAFRPGEAIFLGIVLAPAPYLIFRDVVNRHRRRVGPPGTI